MHDDEADTPQPRRDRPAAPARPFQPAPERRWVLWLLLAVLTVFLLYRGGAWLLAQQRARPAEPPAAAVQPPPAPLPVVRAPPPPAPPAAARAETYGISKCISRAGRAAYTDGPCPEGSRASTVWVQPDVNLTDGLSAEAREAAARSNADIAIQQQQQQPYERRVASNVDNTLSECAGLEARIASLDAAARQPQAGQTQDWLRDERKRARDRQFSLRCR